MPKGGGREFRRDDALKNEVVRMPVLAVWRRLPSWRWQPSSFSLSACTSCENGVVSLV